MVTVTDFPKPPIRRGAPIKHDTPLAKLMKHFGLYHKDLCKATNIDIRTLQHYASGKMQYQRKHLWQLGEFFEIDPEALLIEGDDRPLRGVRF